jgi:cob(I)alamin adenosyltransferase
MKLYTKGGDKGKTSLIGGQRVAKNDIRVEAYGTVDELTAHIALFADRLTLRCKDIAEQIIPDIKRINSALMTVEAHLAVGTGGEDKIAPLPDEVVAWIESRIDALQAELKPITCFTIPGGCEMTSLCHICRTVCRRAERRAVDVDQSYGVDKNSMLLLNRLSDYFYALGRVLCDKLGEKEFLWTK